jgi:flagella basal body P-ring formation protein FlgA
MWYVIPVFALLVTLLGAVLFAKRTIARGGKVGRFNLLPTYFSPHKIQNTSLSSKRKTNSTPK